MAAGGVIKLLTDKMPMDKNSTSTFITFSDDRVSRRRRAASDWEEPRESTLEFIRRFARSYRSLGQRMPEGLRGYSAN